MRSIQAREFMGSVELCWSKTILKDGCAYLSLTDNARANRDRVYWIIFRCVCSPFRDHQDAGGACVPLDKGVPSAVNLGNIEVISTSQARESVRSVESRRGIAATPTVYGCI